MRVGPRVASASPSESAPAGALLDDAARPTIPCRLVRSADFERVLRTRPCALSTHFALHHVATRPSVPHRALGTLLQAELSTEVRTELVRSVDDLRRDDLPTPLAPASERPVGTWLGCVVPKRHARRAVTRTLLKRQIRSAASASALLPGMWVVRLRASFDRAAFPSAASEALRRTARGELDGLLAKASRRAEAGSNRA